MSVVESKPTVEARGTVLEGIRQKVFLDRYSLKDRDGAPIERHPEEMWRRVARGIAEVEAPEKRAFWEERFYEAMDSFKFVPGGRILAGAGTGHMVTYYNCFQGDTPVHVREGIVPIGSLEGEHEVLSEDGIYRRATFQSFGRQKLWAITLANGAVFHATEDHQWVVTEPKGGTTRVTTKELRGRRIPVNARPAPVRNEDFAAGVRHGIVFGDGSSQYGRSHVCLFGESETLASWFEGEKVRKIDSHASVKTHVRVGGLPGWLKSDLPGRDASAAYWRGFVAGLIAADGYVDSRGSVQLCNKDPDILGRVAEGMALAGFVASGISLIRETSPFDGSDKPMYRLQFFKPTVEPEDLLLESHRQSFLNSPSPRRATIQVTKVRPTDRVEEVFCCVEPETHTITIGHGYLTGQCYVIPSPEDSRVGILDNLKLMTEIMARGGGVGVNLSSLRPRGSYIRTVNGTASGPCSWAQLYSVATGDVIQQGGSRRGALMLMLNDDHPDIEEFITVKKRPGMIEHANLSICVSDRFMEAVGQDADWQLIWDGEVKRTVKARALWNLICDSAWAAAEPGLVFMDRYNKLSNTWYYEDIRCVNPCGEQGLPPYGVCNLGALNLATFVKDGKFDYPALAEISKVAIRFLDDVIDANDYFLEENRVAQLGTRRTGLGTMGLADALLALEVRYGTDESLDVIEKIYQTIRDAAYEASHEIAVEKGPFPKYDAEKYAKGEFIQRLSDPLQAKIRKHGTRNAVILTQAPTGTTSLLAGVSSGIEPVFDFAMVRRDRTGEHILYHPVYDAWRKSHPDQPAPDWFVKAADLTPEEHVRVQALIQRYTDSSISKTVNAPNHHTVEEVQTLYRLAYELGCKGVTYYRDGSRDAVLTHLEEKKEEKKPEKATPKVAEVAQLRPRPHVLSGATYRAPTPVGTAFVTINSDLDGNPCEIFITVGRAGSDIAADAEAIGRLISLCLRVPSDLSARSVTEAVIDQLSGIGGSNSLGFGNARVRSLADAVAKVLIEHLATHTAPVGVVLPEAVTVQLSNGNGHSVTNGNGHGTIPARTTGDFCPSCGQIALVNEEGCRKCYVCGFSAC
ncbi:MAG TPA: adenosylcobalamin-dependent ribonucleoside-diphosphate reductase [Chloroflexota bacterium]|nr:adenosylcobalamin-dependent ribonucleoside-diphosphate reductase [Chloroflexota bacterium]